MLDVTPAARECLLSRLDLKNAAANVSMRFIKQKDGWRLRLGQKRPDDTAFTCEGRNVLLLDADAAKAMDTLTLDAKNTAKGTRLKLRRVGAGDE